MQKPQVFECLRCGHVSVLYAVPAQCGSCKYGTGIVRPAKAKEEFELLTAPIAKPDKPTDRA